MSEQMQTEQETASASTDIRSIVRQAIDEFVRAEQQKVVSAYKTELLEERKRREGLESRVNQLVEENRKARAAAEEADKNSQIRAELQRLGVGKIDLAFKAIKDDIVRTEDGRLAAKGPECKLLPEYIAGFVQENPELLPARIAGGSGAQNTSRQSSPASGPGIELERIKPGMSKEDMDRVRAEIARLAGQAMRGV